MRKRTVKKQIWVDRQEAQLLQKKAKKAGVSEAALLRSLLLGYQPAEKPDDRFYEAMRQMSAIGNSLNQLARKANALGFIDAPAYRREAERWNRFQLEVKERFLLPVRVK